ncbi:MAG: hypothetical protein M3P24_05205 [Gemmatimonadota bacterium]|nr:hypothetical protein [Gemmatimonadota bacterium]
MLEIITLAASGTATVFGYLKTREFVRRRLRFVGAVQKPSAPLLAASVVGVLPLVGTGTALLFGAAVGIAVREGAKDVRRGWTLLP